MPNRNRFVVIGLFKSAQEAEAAGEKLKEWDKANDEVKLGGIGVITINADGKFMTDKMGARAQGTGAKVGAALGIAAGVLSGGITVVGGVLAGVIGGAVLGSLREKGVNIEDVHHQLAGELQNGKVALAVMADDFEIEATSAELTRLGAEIMHIAMPDDAVELAHNSEGMKAANISQTMITPGNMPSQL